MLNFIAQIEGEKLEPEVISSEPCPQDDTAVVLENGVARKDSDASKSSSPCQKPLRLLSLDGGGVRGIGTLHILKHIMSKVGGDGVKPCDYFDMIAGTSTGGLLAIMLGRLDMSIDECIEAYNDLSSKIFGQKRGWSRVVLGQSKYSSSTFEETVKEFILKRTDDRESLMMQTNDKHCKVFVVAVPADDVNNKPSLLVRTYQLPSGKKEVVPKGVKIWEACRATTAAPLYFDPMQIGDTHYQDGGLTHNNPMFPLIDEIDEVFGRNTSVQCALSIGTGLAPKVDLRSSTSILAVLRGTFINHLLSLVTNTQRDHYHARTHFNSRDQGCYFRFNVGEKLTDKHWVDERDRALYHSLYGNSSTTKIPNQKEWKNALIALDDYKQMGRFARICEKYIQDGSLEKQVESCAKRLACVRTGPNVRPMTT